MSDPHAVWHIGVVVPAHNEQASIGKCVESIRDSHRRLNVHSVLWIVVSADSCTDRTVMKARAALQSDGEVVECDGRSAGAARRLGVRAALDHYARISSDRIWIANTDADTHVPLDWLERQLGFADEGDLGIAGIVELDSDVMGSPIDAMFQQTYQVNIDGSHAHVHGANLGVRADAYLAVGGWTSSPLAEDHCLWDRLKKAGCRLRSTVLSRVTTSARLTGRAPGGFADTLSRQLAHAQL